MFEIILWFVLINWGAMFFISYLAYMIFTWTPGVKWRPPVRGVLYASVADDSWLSRNLFKKMSKHAANFSFGMCVYFNGKYYQDDYNRTTVIFKRLEVHERVHVKQQLYLGLIQWITYGIFYATLGYKKNPYEVQARNAEASITGSSVSAEIRK
jgi:hypothetical protein